MEILKTVKALQSIGDCKEIDDAVALIVHQGERIAELEEQQRWIPVTERLPEEEGRYLCVVRIGRKSGAVYVKVMNGDSYGFSIEHIYNDDVTHWKPLPEAPKEDT